VWLCDRLLLLIGRNGFEMPDGARASARDGSVLHGKVWATSYASLEDNERRHALLVRFPTTVSPAGLELRKEGRTARIAEAQLARGTTDLRSLLRRHLAALDESARRRFLSMIVDGVHEELADTASYSLAAHLNQIRDALRPPLDARVRTRHDRQTVQVERILGIDERSFWVRGWGVDRSGRDLRVELISPEGHRVSLDSAHRHARPDVDQFFAGADAPKLGVETGVKHGFVSYFELPSPSLISSGWIAELRDPGGDGVEQLAPPLETDLPAVRAGIMTDIKDFGDLEAEDELLCRHVHPALTRLQERLRSSTHADTVMQYGDPVASPHVSVIVPLYGRIDFMEHQLCQFMHDSEFRDLDLMYVLDSPELGDQLANAAAALHSLYELPFRTVVLNRNAGYSIANNIGASLARGRLLVFLNSDVVPDSPGWVGRLASFYDATPGIGALGPKLLYEDASLQHAGLYFDRRPGTTVWTNLHYYKGLRGDFEPANVSRPVPAVTGACLMIARSTWEEMGGLRCDFVQGGYEDSDLCLRLLEAGRDNWYLAHVELHHLEDQSFPAGARLMATAYNEWLQTHLWGEQIEQLMSDGRFQIEAVALSAE